ncbi:FimV family protein [Ferrimonas lipolytica]|uniref:LysM domain-containing protein n=1 Tax=Ferrimonas lipolytica TaxID=2724191 RepID=A0A6H1UI03_9GAMM|nr:hypothetical protein [Ferrimonas lipolytica]QIZ77943.1 hypothetical protein HER31_14190 [Ferrimonas lipolytica]
MRCLWLLLLLFSSVAIAKVDHLSVNRIEQSGQRMTWIYVNVVADQASFGKLRFYLVQQGTVKPLTGRPEGQFMMRLDSEGALTGDAELLVSTLLDSKDDALGRFKLTAAHVIQSVQPLSHAASAKQVPVTNSKATAVVVAQPAVATKSEQCHLAAGESLWRGANRLAVPYGLGRYGMMMALFDANPKHFNSNPQRLVNAELSCPSSDITARWKDEAHAKKQFELNTSQ